MLRKNRNTRVSLLLAAVVLLSVMAALPACGDEGVLAEADTTSEATDSVPAETDSGEQPTGWQSNFEPGLEERDGIRILRLKGTPYEMGRQHAELMREEMLVGVELLENSELGLLAILAEGMGFLAEAKEQSYEAILEECRGMAEVLGDDGWTFDRCLSLAYGEVVLEFLGSGSFGCSQFAVAGDATLDGELIHGRNLDWDEIDFLLSYPTIIVRHPEGRIPFAVVGFPGCIAPYTGMNAAGISVASNEANSDTDIEREGRSHIQMQYEILASATSFAEAREFLETEEHMTAESIMLVDGDRREAAAFEMTANHMGIRDLGEDGVTLLTNHYVAENMIEHHVVLPDDASSKTRYLRLEQLVLPGGDDSLYGSFDIEAAIRVLRDSYNPLTDEEVPFDTFDGAGTIANNGCIHSVVFVPGERKFYVAAGAPHVPSRKFVGFSMAELLDPSAPGPTPRYFPARQ